MSGPEPQLETEPPPALLRVPDALDALRRRYGRAPTYQRLWRALIDGRVPGAEQRQGKHWRVRSDRLADIARFFGLPGAAE